MTRKGSHATVVPRGHFITLEGTEGVGKSTNLARVVNVLKAAGLEVCQTREPGGTPLAEALRALVLEKREETVAPDAELLMIFAARAQHLATVVRPALARGAWVVCDRFTDATYAYQGGGRGMDSSTIQMLEQLVHGDLQPDLTLYLDVAPAVGLTRISDADKDRIELENIAFFERVRAVYLDRAARLNRFRVVDAAHDLKTVEASVAAVVQAYLDGS